MDAVIISYGHRHVRLRRPNAISFIEFALCVSGLIKFLTLRIRRARRFSLPHWSAPALPPAHFGPRCGKGGCSVGVP